jgi:hypothetical protein
MEPRTDKIFTVLKKFDAKTSKKLCRYAKELYFICDVNSGRVRGSLITDSKSKKKYIILPPNTSSSLKRYGFNKINCLPPSRVQLFADTERVEIYDKLLNGLELHKQYTSVSLRFFTKDIISGEYNFDYQNRVSKNGFPTYIPMAYQKELIEKSNKITPFFWAANESYFMGDYIYTYSYESGLFIATNSFHPMNNSYKCFTPFYTLISGTEEKSSFDMLSARFYYWKKYSQPDIVPINEKKRKPGSHNIRSVKDLINYHTVKHFVENDMKEETSYSGNFCNIYEEKSSGVFENILNKNDRINMNSSKVKVEYFDKLGKKIGEETVKTVIPFIYKLDMKYFNLPPFFNPINVDVNTDDVVEFHTLVKNITLTFDPEGYDSANVYINFPPNSLDASKDPYVYDSDNDEDADTFYLINEELDDDIEDKLKYTGIPYKIKVTKLTDASFTDDYTDTFAGMKTQAHRMMNIPNELLPKLKEKIKSCNKKVIKLIMLKATSVDDLHSLTGASSSDNILTDDEVDNLENLGLDTLGVPIEASTAVYDYLLRMLDGVLRYTVNVDKDSTEEFGFGDNRTINEICFVKNPKKFKILISNGDLRMISAERFESSLDFVSSDKDILSGLADDITDDLSSYKLLLDKFEKLDKYLDNLMEKGYYVASNNLGGGIHATPGKYINFGNNLIDLGFSNAFGVSVNYFPRTNNTIITNANSFKYNADIGIFSNTYSIYGEFNEYYRTNCTLFNPKAYLFQRITVWDEDAYKFKKYYTKANNTILDPYPFNNYVGYIGSYTYNPAFYLNDTGYQYLYQPYGGHTSFNIHQAGLIKINKMEFKDNMQKNTTARFVGVYVGNLKEMTSGIDI